MSVETLQSVPSAEGTGEDFSEEKKLNWIWRRCRNLPENTLPYRENGIYNDSRIKEFVGGSVRNSIGSLSMRIWGSKS